MAEEKDPFYVGYQSMPKAHRRLFRKIVPFLLVVFIILGVLLVVFQETPGKGEGWDPTGGSARLWQGMVYSEPYGLFRFRDVDGKIKTALLTSMVKTGVAERLRDLHGRFVQIKGVLIRREERFVLSVLNDKDAIVALSEQPQDDFFFPQASLPIQKNVKLEGEIIDPKCYIGAMKPGEGKTHKACAVLCLKGGIAPMFVIRNVELGEILYLLTDERGKALYGDTLENFVLPFVGDSVSLIGHVEQKKDLLVLKIKPDSIRRLQK